MSRFYFYLHSFSGKLHRRTISGIHQQIYSICRRLTQRLSGNARWDSFIALGSVRSGVFNMRAFSRWISPSYRASRRKRHSSSVLSTHLAYQSSRRELLMQAFMSRRLAHWKTALQFIVSSVTHSLVQVALLCSTQFTNAHRIASGRWVLFNQSHSPRTFSSSRRSKTRTTRRSNADSQCAHRREEIARVLVPTNKRSLVSSWQTCCDFDHASRPHFLTVDNGINRTQAALVHQARLGQENGSPDLRRRKKRSFQNAFKALLT